MESDENQDGPVMIRRMSAEDFLHYPEEGEEEPNDEEEMEEIEVEVEAEPTTAYDFDL